jgi:phosphoribosylaminoimidazole carboxylase (NCAIR synthetase)
MPLADLVQALERDAAAQIRVLLDGAASRVAQLEAEAARHRDDMSAQTAQAWRDECRAGADDQEATTRQAARAAVLTARAAMLERVRAALLAQLPAYASRVLPALERAALACAGDRRFERHDRACGFVLELDTGTHVVATLDALAEREWPSLAAAVVARVDEETAS